MESKVNTAEMLLISFALFCYIIIGKKSRCKRGFRRWMQKGQSADGMQLVWEGYGTEIL